MGLNDLLWLALSSISGFVIPLLMATGSFIIIYILIRFIAYRIRNKIVGITIEDDSYAIKIGDIVQTIVIYVWQAFNILIAFEIIWLDVGILMAWISFGIWFAMQQVLENMMAGFLILTNPMLKVGETISILGQYNVFGVIESLQSRYTVVRLFNGRKLIIPNTMFMKTPIQTYKMEDLVRGDIKFTVEHKVPIDRLKAALMEEINKHPHLMNKDKTQIIPEVVDGAWTNFTVYFYINPKISDPMVWVKSDLRKTVMKTLNKYKVVVPYPKQVIDFT